MDIDMKKLDEIARWFNRSGLSSTTIEYSAKGDFKLMLQKESQGSTEHATMLATDSAQEDSKEVNDLERNNSEKGKAAMNKTEKIKSPIVGTFYRSANPDTPPFVQSGDKVKKGQVLCILEAMKIMNEFEAEFDMEIVSVLVENTQLVEFGQEVFEVKAL